MDYELAGYYLLKYGSVQVAADEAHPREENEAEPAAAQLVPLQDRQQDQVQLEEEALAQDQAQGLLTRYLYVHGKKGFELRTFSSRALYF
jgi:hypothetical protein